MGPGQSLQDKDHKSIKNRENRDLAGGLAVVKTPGFHCRRCGFDPGLEN